MGQGVAKDDVQAYKWDSLALTQGLAIAKQSVAILEQRMSPEQIAEAQRLASEFKPGKETR
jgi:TPR repeat protein